MDRARIAYRGGAVATAAGLCLAVGALMTGAVPAVAQSAGPVLVEEDFRGATAVPEFEGYGSACLTGAPTGAVPAPGDHTLSGCPPSTGPTPPQGGAPDGYLQLTDASNDQAGAVLYTQAIPSTSGVEISFEQWQYGGTQTPAPADGIAFFLVDGAATLDAPGAFGGSLGYAQKLPDDNPANALIPGVDHGYLGIGMDVLGNYFGDWEHRGQNCADGSPAGTAFLAPAPGTNMVTVRGPGDGVDGYCFLTATTSNFTTTGPWPSTLPGQLHGPLTSIPPGTSAADAATLLEPSKRTVTIVITPTPDPQVTVSVDFGSGPVQVLSFRAPQPDPVTYKFGFAASTGGFTDVHLIRNVRVQALTPLPALSLTKQVVVQPGPPPVYAPGDTVTFEFVVTNSGGSPISGVAVADPLVGAISCPATSLAVGDSTTCSGSYTVTAADIARGYVTNTATATGDGPGGTVTSPEARATTPLGGRFSLALQKQVDDAVEYHVGDTVGYEYVVTNDGPNPVTGLTIDDDHLTGISCESTTLAAADEPGSSTVCRGEYVVTASDAAAGSVTNLATASGNGGTVVSPPASATIVVAAVPPTPPPTAAPEAGSSSTLAASGSDVAVALIAAAVLVGAGTTVLIAHRRRPRRHS